MKCEECMRLLEEFVDEELRGAGRHDVEEHICDCSECSSEAEFLLRLSRDAASLPKEIQPGRNLWPGIEAEISRARPSRNGPGASGERKLELKWERRKTAAWGWRVAAVAILSTMLLAAAYLVFRKTAVGTAKQTTSSNTSEEGQIGTTGLRSIPSLDNVSGETNRVVTRSMQKSSASALRSNLSAVISTYPVDPFTRVFVSNYGVYAVGQDRDPQSLAVSRNYILRFNPKGIESWAAPLPPGSTLLSVYPGSGNRLWACYSVQNPEFQTAIDELDFGVDSPIRNVWKSDDLFIGRFVIGPQGWIYAAGFRNDYSKSVAKLAGN